MQRLNTTALGLAIEYICCSLGYSSRVSMEEARYLESLLQRSTIDHAHVIVLADFPKWKNRVAERY